MEEEVIERNAKDLVPEAFRIAMKVLGQPSLCVSRMCGEVVSCSC